MTRIKSRALSDAPHVRLGEEFGGILRIGTAAVQNGDSLRHGIAILVGNEPANVEVHILRLNR